jgi:hypothetical protein
MDSRQELREELIAVLGAGRELSAESDSLLADVFLKRLDLTIESRKSVRQRMPTSVGLLGFFRSLLVTLLVLLLIAPAIAFLINFPSDGVLRHIDSGAIPLVYYVVAICLCVCIAATSYLERHSVYIRMTPRRKHVSN